MGDVVNLNRARKTRAKAEREQQAAQNRIKFGRPKSEVVREQKDRERQARDLDGHQRDD